MVLINSLRKLIPLIISNCVDRKSLPIYGDGQNVRDWLYVKDHCKALYQILKKERLEIGITLGEIMKLLILKSLKQFAQKWIKLDPFQQTKNILSLFLL